MTAEQLYSTASYLAGDLTGVDLSQNDLHGWSFAGQIVNDAHFSSTTDSGFTAQQLYSTASYQAGDLSGIHLDGNDLTGWDFSGQDLTGAHLTANLTDANFADAVITDVDFVRSNVAASQLYLTANYREGNLRGLRFNLSDFTGIELAAMDLSQSIFVNVNLNKADFAGANLTEANLSNSDLVSADLSAAKLVSAQLGSAVLIDANLRNADLRSASLTRSGGADLTRADLSSANLANTSFSGVTLTGANLRGADARGAQDLSRIITTDGKIQNLIHPDGDIEGLSVASGETMRLWDYYGEEIIPIVVQDGMQVDEMGILRAVFEDRQWDSTIRFGAGVPVSLGGTLALDLHEDGSWPDLVGATYQLFDWTNVIPDGEFSEVVTRHHWDLSKLYATGEVTLLAVVPEPTTGSLLLGASLTLLVIRLTRR